MSDWEFGLCDCMRNTNVYCFILCLPCTSLLFIQSFNARLSNPHNPSADAFAALIGCFGCACGMGLNRYFLREKLGIQGSYRKDCCVWCCCPICAATQEYMQTAKVKLGDEKLYITQALSMKVMH
jgi:Cys-rich protein (TIGR01571 family)